MQPKPKPVKAAQYMRMSTEKQVYSTANQQSAIAAYARFHNFEVVRTYIDAGRSGLKIKGREALQEMLSDVLSGNAGYRAILVFDVSRWGRFQDADESAHYEFICRRAGVPVHYCAELFENDLSLASAVLKNLRRVMAGEFSRDLSAKVWNAQCRLVALGYKMGGKAGYGHQRMLVGSDGKPKQILRNGEHKSIVTDRVILVPGLPDEVATVQRIYGLAARGWPNPDIARMLNEDGVPGPTGEVWSKHMVRQILINERYAGVAVFNRRSAKLGGRPLANPRATWIRRPGAYEPLISPALFLAVQRKVRSAKPEYTDAQLLRHLRRLLAEHGRLARPIIEAAAPPAAKTYSNRFGSMAKAYARIGYDPTRDAGTLIGAQGVAFAAEAHAAIRQQGGRVRQAPMSKLLTVDNKVILALRLCNLRAGQPYSYWRVKRPPSEDIDFVLAELRRDGEREHLYLFPARRFGKSGKIDVRDGPNLVESYRVWSLKYLYEMLLMRTP